MRKRNTDHVRVRNATDGRAIEVFCQHCKSQASAPLPISLSEIIETVEGFTAMHAHCEPEND